MEDWHDLINNGTVVMKQVAWERRQIIRRAVEAGVQQKEIADRLGISGPRVWALLQKAKAEVGRLSPVEEWMNRGLEIESPVQGRLLLSTVSHLVKKEIRGGFHHVGTRRTLARRRNPALDHRPCGDLHGPGHQATQRQQVVA